MSFDLYAWHTPLTTDEDEAEALFKRYADSDDETVFAQSQSVRNFYEALIRALPPRMSEDVPAEEDPWSVAPMPSDRIVAMHLRWSTPGGTLDTIVDLARRHGLVLYDPQGPSIHSPALDDDEPVDVDIPGQLRQATIAGLAGAAIIYGATFIPWRIISWPLMAIGAFLALGTIYTYVVIWKPEWQIK